MDHSLKTTLIELKKHFGKQNFTYIGDRLDSQDKICSEENTTLKAGKYALTLVDLIEKININNTPKIVGILGQWGRGKTCFWQLIKESYQKLSKSDENSKKQYIFAEFQAWKYQNVPNIWINLYETIREKILKEKSLFKLYDFFKTLGKYFLIIFFFLLIYYFLFGFNDNSLIYNYLNKIKLFFHHCLAPFWQKIIYWGLLFCFFKAFIIFLRKGIFIFRELTSENKFFLYNFAKNQSLGWQNFIEKQLEKLISIKIFNIYIPNPFLKNTKIILFIDNLDRCPYTQIINVIDYLRVVLENDKILDKMTVYIAVDVKILKLAIENKYKDIKDKAGLFEEYLEKLFTLSINLLPLNREDRNKIMDNFYKPTEQMKKSGQQEKFENISLSDIYFSQNELFIEEEYFDMSKAFFYGKNEFEFLKDKIINSDNIKTPRKLQNIVLRYLFAKRIFMYYDIYQKHKKLILDCLTDLVIKYEAFDCENICERKNKQKDGNKQIENDKLKLNQLFKEISQIIAPYSYLFYLDNKNKKNINYEKNMVYYYFNY